MQNIETLKRVRNCVPAQTLNIIYNALVPPHSNYCAEVWDSCGSTSCKKLQKLPNRAARVLTNSSYDASADPLIESFGWKKLASKRKFQKAVMVFKSRNGLAPEYTQAMFEDRNCLPYSLRLTARVD